MQSRTAGARELTYVIDSKKIISLDIFEAEYYDAAVVVQPLVGNLVYYSNRGKYEPRIAESWERVKPESWKFRLRSGFTCENGELITAASFKRSLERMILHSARKGGSPVFGRLEGYEEFIKSGENLVGIQANDTDLTFNFHEPLSGGLIEVLSFAPYGYICEENLLPSGQWKDAQKFISSGPYRVDSIQPGERYDLSLREEWSKLASPNAPKKVTILQSAPSSPTENIILDSHTSIEQLPPKVSQFDLVPEYLNAILLGNLDNGFFSAKQNREAFVSKLETLRDELPEKIGVVQLKSSSFYSNIYTSANSENKHFAGKPATSLIIEGVEPTPESWKYPAWSLLKSALLTCGFDYKFAGNGEAWSKLRSTEFDLRLRGTSVGGSADVWGIEVIFCSMIGPNYPDPGGAVCSLVKKYQDQKIDQSEFEKEFLRVVRAGAAIVPVSHFGRQLYLGPGIDRASLDPTLVVVRFDQLDLK